ncbi:MAG: hypothetical protein AB1749_04065 [Pseudomonadota bacterium]
MRRSAIWGLAVALALASTAAVAFQEQKTGTMAPQGGDAIKVAPEPELGLSTTAPKSSAGTEVRIPGLGKLGVLPKMDFGLELLYGAADQKQADPLPRDDAPTDDLTIRGTVKHRF